MYAFFSFCRFPVDFLRPLCHQPWDLRPRGGLVGSEGGEGLAGGLRGGPARPRRCVGPRVSVGRGRRTPCLGASGGPRKELGRCSGALRHRNVAGSRPGFLPENTACGEGPAEGGTRAASMPRGLRAAGRRGTSRSGGKSPILRVPILSQLLKPTPPTETHDEASPHGRCCRAVHTVTYGRRSVFPSSLFANQSRTFFIQPAAFRLPNGSEPWDLPPPVSDSGNALFLLVFLLSFFFHFLAETT